MDCLFCKILAGEIPSNKVYEDEYVYAFYDIEPQAPVHFLVIPKVHIASAAEVTGENSLYVAKAYEAIAKIAPTLGLENGFRVVANVGEDGLQTVQHLHFHVLGKRKMAWPPG
ncbi:MAG: histidine triad nucleotide-binding protein [Eubacteriales bacterium]|jgi:histidine triad (HIT) family protein